MGAINRMLAFIVMGAVAMLTVALPISMLLMSAKTMDGSPNVLLIVAAVVGPTLSVVVVAALIVILAPTGRHAWGRLALFDAIACFALPFLGVAFAAIVGTQGAHLSHGDPGMAAAGAAIAGVALVGGLGFLGFFAGLILVVIAYFVLRGAPKPDRARAPAPPLIGLPGAEVTGSRQTSIRN